MGTKILSTITEPAVLFFFLALACLATCVYLTHKNFKVSIDSNNRIAELLARCMDHLKAQSLEERVPLSWILGVPGGRGGGKWRAPARARTPLGVW